MTTSVSRINNNIKISGDLSNNQSINIINLDILGDLIIDIGEGTINLIDTHAKNIILYQCSISNLMNSEISLDIVPSENSIDLVTNLEIDGETPTIYTQNKLEKFFNKFKNFFK